MATYFPKLPLLLYKSCWFMLTVCAIAPALDQSLTFEIFEEIGTDTFIANIKTSAELQLKHSPEVLEQLHFVFITRKTPVQFFALDGASGILKTSPTRNLDREQICPKKRDCNVQLEIAVQPTAYFEVITVRLTILDLNDNAPKFPSDVIQSDLLESNPPGPLFPVLPAEDLDSPRNGIKRYELISDSKMFRLHVANKTDGNMDLSLELLRHLNREERDSYRLVIVAYDGGSPAKSGSVTLNVRVLDVNDNNPKFDQSHYEVFVREDLSANSTIIRVHATDQDIGLNGAVSYRFEPRTRDLFGDRFAIGRTTGEVTLRKKLDYENREKFTLGVIAEDGGEGSVPIQTQVLVNVLDVNDHGPNITVNTKDKTDVVYLRENQNGDSFVAHISVKDADSGNNGDVSCDIDDNNFKLQQLYDTEYKLVTRGSLDREMQSEHHVIVYCHDMGEPQQTSVVNVRVTVLDLNDNAPVFSQNSYEISIQENNKINEFITRVSATDDDAGDNGIVRYSLEEKSTELFNIDSKNGVITAAVAFDRENMKSIRFNVLASDRADSPRTSTAVIKLTILDMDDQPPTFTKERYSFRVAENEKTKVEVGNVAAIDSDLPPNNKFSFFLDASDSPTDIFNIDPFTGAIYTKKSLDREEKAIYHLSVIVQSDTVPHLSDNAKVTIQVLDKNDNTPVVHFPNSRNNTAYISSLAPIGHVAARIRATDADVGKNAELTYKLTKGNEDGYFVINKYGEMLVEKDLSAFDTEVFDITVLVQDGGSPQKMTMSTINVVVNRSYIVERATPKWHSQTAVFSPDHVTIVASVAIGCFLIVVILIVAIILVKRRKKFRNDDRKYDDIPQKVEKPILGSTDGEKHTELNDVTPESRTDNNYGGTDCKDRDQDSGFADISHCSIQAPPENIHQVATLPRAPPYTASQGGRCVGVHEPPQQQQQQQQQPSHMRRRHPSFSEWLHAEGQNLDLRGNSYHVSDHAGRTTEHPGTLKKSVRFVEPLPDPLPPSVVDIAPPSPFSNPKAKHEVSNDKNMPKPVTSYNGRTTFETFKGPIVPCPRNNSLV